MQTILSIVFIIAIVVCSVAIWWLYHKIFHVYYFDLGRGCIMEFLGCFTGGIILAGILLKFWYVGIILIGIIGFAIIKKKH